MDEAKTLKLAAGYLPYQATQAFRKRRDSTRRTRSIRFRGGNKAPSGYLHCPQAHPVSSAD
jgi:hypothetical protein